MNRTFILLTLAVIVLAGCVSFTAAAGEVAAAAQTASPTLPPPPTSTASCAVTGTIQTEPPREPNADPFGFGDWHVNDHQTIWVRDRDWRVGGHKVVWIRPQGTNLEISGHRLDGEAPPMDARIPRGYITGFQVTGLIFPSEGCWEVIATAGKSELRFVTQVAPAEELLSESACDSLAEVVESSAAILVVSPSSAGARKEAGYAWIDVDVHQSWKPLGGPAGYGTTVLQDLGAEPALERGGRYLLFLQPGRWRLLCAQRTLYQLSGDQAIPLGDDPIWPVGLQEDLKAEIQKLLNPP
jgi:hypothetical protein